MSEHDTTIEIPALVEQRLESEFGSEFLDQNRTFARAVIREYVSVAEGVASGQRDPAKAIDIPEELSDEMVRVALAVQRPATYREFLHHPSDGPTSRKETEILADIFRRQYAAVLHLVRSRRVTDARARVVEDESERLAHVESNPCIAKVKTGEPFFVLLGRDRHAPGAVEAWSKARRDERGPSEKTAEADRLAEEMRAYAKLHEA